MSTISLTIFGNPIDSKTIITVSELNSMTINIIKIFILLTDNNFNIDLFFNTNENK
jgi:hypothetical protein